ncbi:MAG: efflux RND transporter periplasmic adaptor subunit [Cyclobacteriaceae bacterium]|nr:efflux RND transporter periplasmic adaptor subunit [Cyclobacteriaceae bacterium]
MSLRQSIIVAVLVLLGMVVAGGFFASLKKKDQTVGIKAPPKYVQTAPVAYSTISTNITTFGRVESSQPIELIAEVSGRILPGRVPLKESQDFKKGSLLYRIDDAESRLDLKSEKSNFLRDLATILPDLKIDFPETYAKWDAYFQSIDIDKVLPELPEYQSEKEKTFLATKNIFSTYFSIKRSETSLNKHLVYAPFRGSYTEVALESGAYVNPGNRIARIVRRGKLELKIPIETSEIKWVQEGNQVNVSTEDGLMSWEGRIKRVGEVVNQTTQSIDVIIDILPNENTVYDGLYLKAEIPGIEIPEAIEMDRAAFYNGSQVYVVEQDSLLKVKEVTVHRLNSKTVVFSGLESGAMLVTEPLVNAYNNMFVTTKRPEEETENADSQQAELAD